MEINVQAGMAFVDHDCVSERFVTSDQHFGHGGALGLFHRPFASVREMDEALIAAWNGAVGLGDEVWCLGDFAYRPKRERLDELLSRLNGVKRLIAGNNDGARPQAGSSLAAGAQRPAASEGAATLEHPAWAEVREMAELRVQVDGRERLAVLCHYPLRSWNGMAKGAVQLHGHSHGRLEPWPRQLDVGVDAVGFAPLPLEDAAALAATPVKRRATALQDLQAQKNRRTLAPHVASETAENAISSSFVRYRTVSSVGFLHDCP